MKFVFLEGKNYKYFVKMEDVVTANDIEAHKIVQKTLYRSEYNPFLKGTFSKTIEASYLYYDYIFPYQLFDDVVNALKPFVGVYLQEDDLKLINDPKLPTNDGRPPLFDTISREYFDQWLHTLHIPDYLKIDAQEYRYQQDSVFAAINNRNGRVEIATSGGKTFITYMYCKYLLTHCNTDNLKILIVVPSQLLCKQLKADFYQYDRHDDLDIDNGVDVIVETIYSNSKRISNANVVVGTFQSLCNYDEEYFEDFFALVCDELHRAKAYSIRNGIYAKIKTAKYVFGMTGTFPEYKSLEYLHIASMFGSLLVEKSAYDLIQDGVATDVVIRNISFDYHINGTKVKSIYDMFPELISDGNKYWTEKHILSMIEARYNVICDLINSIPKNSIVFVTKVDDCIRLHELISRKCPSMNVDMIHGEIHHEKRTAAIERMQSSVDGCVIVATIQTMSTGVSINTLTNAYLVGVEKSSVSINQSLGRLMRLFDGKEYATVFDFRDDLLNSYSRRHGIERDKIYAKRKCKISQHQKTINITEEEINNIRLAVSQFTHKEDE